MTSFSRKGIKELIAFFKDLMFRFYMSEKAAHDYQFLLRRAKKLCVQVPAAAEPSILERFQGRLIHVTDSLLIEQAAEDRDLNIKLEKDPIILKRKVEMLKYRAGRNSILEWTEVPCDEEKDSAKNAIDKKIILFSFQLKSAIFYSKAVVGSFSLSEEQLRALENWSPCDLSENVIAKLTSIVKYGYKSYNKRLVGDGLTKRTYLYFNKNDQPQWGDVRVSYEAVVAPEKITVVGVLQENSLRAFTYDDALLCARPGFFTAPPLPVTTLQQATYTDGVWPFVVEKAKAVFYVTPGTQRLHEAIDHEDNWFWARHFRKRIGAMLITQAASAALLLCNQKIATYADASFVRAVGFFTTEISFIPFLIFLSVLASWPFFAFAALAVHHPIRSAVFVAVSTFNSASAFGTIAWLSWLQVAVLFALGILRRAGGEEARFEAHADLVRKEAAAAMAEAAASDSTSGMLSKAALVSEAACEGGTSLAMEN